MSHYKEITKIWKDSRRDLEIDPEIELETFSCFCHEYRCPHREYSSCPKDCEKPRVRDFCPLGTCQMALQHPEECEKQNRELQEKRHERVKHIHTTYGHPENR